MCLCSVAGGPLLTHTGCRLWQDSWLIYPILLPSQLLAQGVTGDSTTFHSIRTALSPAAVIGPRVESSLGRGQRRPHDMPDCCPQVVVVEQNGSFQVKIPKNFICEHCFGAFRSSYHLKRHVLIHTGESAVFSTFLFTLVSLCSVHTRVQIGEESEACAPAGFAFPESTRRGGRVVALLCVWYH